jgi:acyl-CoA thioesterase-1
MRKSIFLLPLVLWAGTATAEPVTIAALGDSLTQGYGLPAEDGFVPQLQSWLIGQGADVELINAGVSGDTTAGGASRVAWTLTPEVDAMIVTLGGNDLLRGLEPSMSRTHLEKILSTAQASDVEVLLVGMEAPGNFGPDYKDRFDAMYPELAQSYGTLFAPGFFDGLIKVAGDDPAAMRPYFQADGIHPNADGVAHIVEGLGPYVLDLIDRVEAAQQ